MGILSLFKGKKEEKLNPSQPYIAQTEGMTIASREFPVNYTSYYETIEVVNRGINMIVDDAADIPCTIGEALKNSPIVSGMRKATLDKLLNVEPNPFQDISTFKRNLIIDYLIDGNIFIYYDGAHLYHLPANKVIIHSDTNTYINHYEFVGIEKYSVNEIIHIKDNSFRSIYRGISRLRPANRSMNLLKNMRNFQNNFFENDAIPGLALKTDNVLSDKIKDRIVTYWQNRFSPKSGGRTPVVLDGGLDIKEVVGVNFKELDFQSSIESCEKTILKSLGIPPILLDGGNNANIRPNHRLYYLETILPIVRKLNSAFSRFFGYEIWEDIVDTPALQPELSDQASYFSTLVNAGIITPNEARDPLGMEPLEGLDGIRIPANIAGSAADPSVGGRPPESGTTNE